MLFTIQPLYKLNKAFMFDCAPKTKNALLRQLGLDIWVSRQGVVNKPSECHIWLERRPEKPEAWQLLDAILAVLQLQRTELQISFAGTPPQTMQPPGLMFADTQPDCLPSLQTLLTNPKTKAQAWQQLQTLI